MYKYIVLLWLFYYNTYINIDMYYLPNKKGDERYGLVWFSECSSNSSTGSSAS